jgi:hypothetical protein
LSSFFGSEAREEPWEIPAEAFPTQRLYRVRYEGPEGHASFKLTLYLVAKGHFRMRAADGLGRKVWDLAVDQSDKALWLDHRNNEYCLARGASRLAIVPLARLPLAALPKLLLGRLPSPPQDDLQRSPEALTYRDAHGVTWHGGLAEGRLLWWTLLEEGTPVTWWRQEGEESVFIDLTGKQKLTWREVVHEVLTRAPEPLRVPARYSEGACGEAAR